MDTPKPPQASLKEENVEEKCGGDEPPASEGLLSGSQLESAARWMRMGRALSLSGHQTASQIVNTTCQITAKAAQYGGVALGSGALLGGAAAGAALPAAAAAGGVIAAGGLLASWGVQLGGAIAERSIKFSQSVTDRGMQGGEIALVGAQAVLQGKTAQLVLGTEGAKVLEQIVEINKQVKSSAGGDFTRAQLCKGMLAYACLQNMPGGDPLLSSLQARRASSPTSFSSQALLRECRLDLLYRYMRFASCMYGSPYLAAMGLVEKRQALKPSREMLAERLALHHPALVLDTHWDHLPFEEDEEEVGETINQESDAWWYEGKGEESVAEDMKLQEGRHLGNKKGSGAYGREVHAPGYSLILDPDEESLVLAVRGTLSFGDVLTDLNCRTVPLTDHPLPATFPAATSNTTTTTTAPFTATSTSSPPCGPSSRDTNSTSSCSPAPTASPPLVAPGHVHEGMWKSALQLDTIIREQVARELAQRPGWRLVVTGHSLGAGVASLLTLLWVHKEVFPGRNIQCFAFAPPCILDRTLAQSMESHVISVVLGDDFVCRWSIGSTQDILLAAKLLSEEDGLVEKCLSWKATDMISSRLPSSLKDLPQLASSISSGNLENKNNLPEHQDPKDASASDSEWHQSVMSALNASMQNEKIYPAGRIVFIPSSSADGSLSEAVDSTKFFDVSRALLVENDMLGRIKLSSRMISDHMPKPYEQVLMKLSSFHGYRH